LLRNKFLRNRTRRLDSFASAPEAFRSNLTLLARRVLAPDLAAKIAASDLVQEAFPAAGCDIAHLRNRSPANLRCWPLAIRQHLLASTRRRQGRGGRRRSRRRRAGVRAGTRPCFRQAAKRWTDDRFENADPFIADFRGRKFVNHLTTVSCRN
jgi:DNA-directed RNA polymerase specialized sigma24 family protein